MVKKSLLNNLYKTISYLIFNTKKFLTQSRLAFTKALIFWQFDLKCYIWIKIYVLSYIIDRVLS